MNNRKVKMVIAPLLVFWFTIWAYQPAQGGTFHCPAQPDNLKIIAFGDSRPPYHPNKIRLLQAMNSQTFITGVGQLPGQDLFPWCKD